jgi:hypothetical protein
VPDYSSEGLDLSRSMFGMAWFQTRRAFEESRHRPALREYLIRSTLRSEEEFEALEKETPFRGAGSCPSKPVKWLLRRAAGERHVHRL